MPADNRAQFPANVILVRRTCRYEIDDKDKALMYITGGDNLDSPYHWKGNEDIELAIALSLAVKCVGIVLFQVPNQPIIFTDDVLRHKRSEDATIAFTWDHFHRHQNETEWLLRLPMVSWSPPLTLSHHVLFSAPCVYSKCRTHHLSLSWTSHMGSIHILVANVLALPPTLPPPFHHPANRPLTRLKVPCVQWMQLKILSKGSMAMQSRRGRLRELRSEVGLRGLLQPLTAESFAS